HYARTALENQCRLRLLGTADDFRVWRQAVYRDRLRTERFSQGQTRQHAGAKGPASSHRVVRFWPLSGTSGHQGSGSPRTLATRSRPCLYRRIIDRSADLGKRPWSRAAPLSRIEIECRLTVVRVEKPFLVSVSVLTVETIILSALKRQYNLTKRSLARNRI